MKELDIKYDVTDLDGNHHGRFSQLKDAKEQAQEMANHLQKDMFIEETKKEIVESIMPE